MKTLLTALSVLTIGTTVGSFDNSINKIIKNNYKIQPFSIDGKDYIGDKIYDISFWEYISHETFLKVKDIYLNKNLPIEAIKKLNNLFKTFSKEKDLPFREADYEKLSTVIYNNFSRIYMVNKQTNKGVKIKIGFNQADFLVSEVFDQ